MRFLVLLTLVVGLSAASCQTTGTPQVYAPAVPVKPAADPDGAISMRPYFMAFLRRGPTWTGEDTPEVERVSKAHMAHIQEMAASGKLLIAGPFDVDGTPKNALAGIFIFDVPTIEEARALASDDPGVKAGRFTIEVLTWYGPRGLTYAGHKH